MEKKVNPVIKFEVVDGVDFPFEEEGNQFNAFRKIRWGDNPTARLELRRWRVNPDGSEQAAKGMTFLTEEGPGELARILIASGHGNTQELLKEISSRDDFRKSLNSILGEDDEFFDESAGTCEDDYYDPNELLG